MHRDGVAEASSVDLGHVDEVLAEDAARLGDQVFGGDQWRDLDVRRDRTDIDLAPEVASDCRLDLGPSSLSMVLEERLRLRKAEGDDVAVDGDGSALGEHCPGRWPDRADDGGPV